jgi:hypothetical protein
MKDNIEGFAEPIHPPIYDVGDTLMPIFIGL